MLEENYAEPSGNRRFQFLSGLLKLFCSIVLDCGREHMTSLLIVESPAKCKKIQGFLGSGWRVTATMGHIRSLEEDLDALGLDRDFDPRYAFLKEKSRAISELKEAAKGASQIFLASDDDREGEAIAYSVAVLLKLDPTTTPRAVFHEITAPAVRKAVAEPRRIDMSRVLAQQARAVLDMMVGFTISPLLWKYVAPKLSAGRCQTPALRILADREQQIRGFSSQRTWKIAGRWTAANGYFFEAVLKDELDDEESARNYLENLHDDSAATVIEAETRPWTEGAPKPLITSTLQQEASALYSLPPKKAMSIAQKLYEAGHITYMRTDHAVLSEEAAAAAKAQARKLYGDSFVAAVTAAAETAPKKTKKKEEAADGAHEAIRPTHMEYVELDGADWTATDRKVYKLIWMRTIQSVMAAAKGDERAITFVARGDPGEFPWGAKWRRTTFAGWKKVGQAAAYLDEAEAAAAEAEADSLAATWIQAIHIRKDDTINWSLLSAHPVDSKAPPRLNEATLVRELEKKGIGRPSTFASLVGTLIEREYAKKEDVPARDVELLHLELGSVGKWPPTEQRIRKKVGGEKDKLIPTALGMSVLDFCLREFGSLFEYGFTATMESRLDQVAEGAENWKQVCRDTWGSYKDHYQELKAGKSKEVASGKLREFGGGLKAVLSKKGPLLLREDSGGDKEKTVFYGWPSGLAFADMTAEKAADFIAGKAVEGAEMSAWGSVDGQAILEKKGPYGRYVVCGDVKVPLAEGDTPETVAAKIQTKKATGGSLVYGNIEVRQGPYGWYMMKRGEAGTARGGKKPTFVGLPQGVDPKSLTAETAEQFYTAGAARGSGGGRGRGGFRGGGRGGGRGRGRGGAAAQ